MTNLNKGRVAAAAFFCIPLLLVTDAAAQENVVTSAQGCSVLAADNVQACCAEQNREAVAPFLTGEGLKICALSSEERERFFSEQSAVAPAVSASPVARGAPAGTTAAASAQATAPEEELANPGNNEAVGRAGETPGNNPEGSFGDGEKGRSDVAGAGGATAGASGSIAQSGDTPGNAPEHSNAGGNKDR